MYNKISNTKSKVTIKVVDIPPDYQASMLPNAFNSQDVRLLLKDVLQFGNIESAKFEVSTIIELNRENYEER
jgi:hypothetical protein